MENLLTFPLPFFLSVVALVGFGLYAWNHRNAAWGLPLGMVLATVAVWYHGDALYNDYQAYRLLMGDEALAAGWWQVLLFIVTLGFLVPPVHRLVNRKFQGRRSPLMRYIRTRKLEDPRVQRPMDRLAMLMLIAWVILMAVALVRVKFDFAGLFAPYLGHKAHPWSRDRVGGGIDAILSLAGYVQIFLASGFGVIAAVARNPKTRGIALVVCALTFPYYIFDRTRNAMIATMLPGFLAWTFLRLRGGLMTKAAVLLAGFLAVNFWFGFVIANRTAGSIAAAVGSNEAVEKAEDAKHAGLSMFSELGYMNDYFERGTYTPNWGERYFAELVNPIPRALWKNKPYVGVDYAIARGFTSSSASESSAGITASIATGMIGQGIVNFGRFFGPIAAAILMALWVAILARQDLMSTDPARLLLYACGMILTFNMGRDITLLVLYPYLFGWMLLSARSWYRKVMDPAADQRPKRNRKRRGRRRPAHRRPLRADSDPVPAE